MEPKLPFNFNSFSLILAIKSIMRSIKLLSNERFLTCAPRQFEPGHSSHDSR